MPAEADMRCSNRYTGKLALMTIEENVPLAPLTTLQVGGADGASLRSCGEKTRFARAYSSAKRRELPLFVLGGGSNLVVADSGWPGRAKIAIGGIAHPTTNDTTGNAVLFSVGAGVNWDDFVAQAVAQNCAGVECLSGIPGSVGGTPVENVGAYGQEVSNTIESVRALDLKQDRIGGPAQAGLRIPRSRQQIDRGPLPDGPGRARLAGPGD